jgi:hypothetical protein
MTIKVFWDVTPYRMVYKQIINGVDACAACTFSVIQPLTLTPNYQTIYEHTNPVHNVKPLANHYKHVLFETSGFHTVQFVTTNLYRATSHKNEIN